MCIRDRNRNIGGTRPRRYTTTPIWRNAFTTYNTPMNTTMNDWANQFMNNTFWDNVLVYPTQAQIQAATSSVNLADLPPGTINCPITMENFNSESDIVRINHCGHVFCRNALMRWFRNHISCPVCRYDIRQNTDVATRRDEEAGVADENENEDEDENETNETANNETTTTPRNVNHNHNHNQNDTNNQTGPNVNHQLYQFDFTLGSGSGTDLINNVINGLSNLNISNDGPNRTTNYNHRRYEY